jgi:hypothetical protein
MSDFERENLYDSAGVVGNMALFVGSCLFAVLVFGHMTSYTWLSDQVVDHPLFSGLFFGTSWLAGLFINRYVKKRCIRETWSPKKTQKAGFLAHFPMYMPLLWLSLFLGVKSSDEATEWFNFHYKDPTDGTVQTYYSGHQSRRDIVWAWLSLQGLDDELAESSGKGEGTFAQRLGVIASRHHNDPIKIVDADNRVFELPVTFDRGSCRAAIREMPEKFMVVAVNGKPLPFPAPSDDKGSASPKKIPDTSACNQLRGNSLVIRSVPNAFE